jgi:hydrogenase nickel incorporation protein HypA/HybF
MHETSLAQSVIDSVMREMTARHLDAVQKIVLRVGPWSGVMPEALQFNYEVLRADTPLAHTELVIQETSLHAHCTACQFDFIIADLNACPRCRSEQIQLNGGDELDIAFLETGA